MDTQSEPSGPDLTQGVPATSLPDGGTISGHVGEEPVLLVRLGDDILAIGSKCTHYGGPLGEGLVSGDTVRCPWHHACFSLRTGEAIRAPAFDPVPCWRAEVLGDQIVVREKLPKPSAETVSIQPDARFVIVGGGAAGFAAAEMRIASPELFLKIVPFISRTFPGAVRFGSSHEADQHGNER